MQLAFRSTQGRGKAGQNRGEEREEVGTDTKWYQKCWFSKEKCKSFFVSFEEMCPSYSCLEGIWPSLTLLWQQNVKGVDEDMKRPLMESTHQQPFWQWQQRQYFWRPGYFFCLWTKRIRYNLLTVKKNGYNFLYVGVFVPSLLHNQLNIALILNI